MGRYNNSRCKSLIFIIICGSLYLLYMSIFKSHILHPNVNLEHLSDSPKITAYNLGRTGNSMFIYASLIGIAHKNNLIPVISRDAILWDVFKIPIHSYSGSFQPEVTIVQNMTGAYEKGIENLSSKNTLLDGYWQSWKYFIDIKEELLTKHFVFFDDTDSEAEEFLENAMKIKGKSKDVTLIGVHVRRGDFVRQRLKGFTAAPVSYYYKAMNYFRRKYSDVLFIMISNDVFWAEDHLDQGPDVFYSHNTPDKSTLDLAILTKCNHSIISSGSFSWWSGYLAGGEVIYYHLYPEENTRIGSGYVKKDYYPPHWIPY